MGTPERETMASARERLAADEAAGEFNSVPSTPVSGTEESPAPPQPAEAENTDTGGPPENIPYARFKEVNDQLRDLKGYAPLSEAGYDPDSVGRLVAFEEAYREDPTGTIAQVVDAMDLPDATKQIVQTALRNGEPAQSEDSSGDQEPEEPPSWAKPLIEDHQVRQQRETNEYYDNMLNSAINHWEVQDKKDGIETDRKTILRQIRASVDDGQFSTVEELAEHARSELMQYREATLGSALVTRRTGPSSIPGSGVPRGEPVSFGSDIKAATKAAEAAIHRGELPPIQP